MKLNLPGKLINFAILTGSIVVPILICELFLATFMPVSIGVMNRDWYQLSENPEIVYEPKAFVGEHNSQGLRDFEYPIQKPKGIIRIAVIGDSLAYGFGVEMRQTYAKQLELKLNKNLPNAKYEVLNFGVGGYDISKVIARMKEKVLSYDPDVIIYGFWMDDVTESGSPISLWRDDLPTNKSRVKLFDQKQIGDLDGRLESVRKIHRFFRTTVKVLLKSQIVRRTIVWLNELEEQKMVAEINIKAEKGNLNQNQLEPEIKKIYENYLNQYKDGIFRDVKGYETYFKEYANLRDFIRFNRSLKEFSEICHDRKISCIILITPVLHDPDYPWHGIHDLIKALGTYYRFGVLDVTKALRNSNKLSELRSNKEDPEHPSAFGHLLIADEIINFLGNQKLFTEGIKK